MAGVVVSGAPVVNALRMAVNQEAVSNADLKELTLHSDRGSQYAREACQQVLTSMGITCSMSRKGNCWDNATIESFFATLKKELVYHERYKNRSEARSSLFEYIEVFYNRVRKHSALGYLSPAQFTQVT
ncbi:integrase core domain-containing protein [uncultured Rubinisphaera sp.]|uniref:integrase core domain-containing protein n=1 Tax=Rubinisphaera sp. TaxID=2024857 RepID=UPI0030DAB0FB